MPTKMAEYEAISCTCDEIAFEAWSITGFDMVHQVNRSHVTLLSAYVVDVEMRQDGGSDVSSPLL